MRKNQCKDNIWKGWFEYLCAIASFWLGTDILLLKWGERNEFDTHVVLTLNSPCVSIHGASRVSRATWKWNGFGGSWPQQWIMWFNWILPLKSYLTLWCCMAVVSWSCEARIWLQDTWLSSLQVLMAHVVRAIHMIQCLTGIVLIRDWNSSVWSWNC